MRCRMARELDRSKQLIDPGSGQYSGKHFWILEQDTLSHIALPKLLRWSNGVVLKLCTEAQGNIE